MELSVEQRRSIITLIPKKSKNRLFLKNWRPISLLNTDYKILTKVLSNRLSSVLPDIVDEDQTGYIKGRFIGTNIRLIEDIIHFTKIKNIPGIILNIDFEKAFDSINWNFIDLSLEAFNFGPKFRSYIKTLYTNISSTIINNGEISNWFNIQRGVRQGCPLSPYLFIIAVELLAIRIRENPQVKGIKVGDTEIKISQLADDTTCFLNNLESITVIMRIFDEFKNCAGLQVNVEKTKATFIGSFRDRVDSPLGLDWSTNYIDTLGVKLSVKGEDHYNLNFKDKILNLKNILRIWKGRHLSLKGKATIINTLALSPILYLASVIHVPDNVIKEVKQCIVNFLWDGGSTKIAYDVTCQQIQYGGLKLTDFEDKVKSLKLMWIKRLSSEEHQRWKASPAIFYNTDNFTQFFSYNLGPLEYIPKFYQDVQNFWSETQKIETLSPKVIMNQVIWCNRYITINKKPFRWDKWLKKGIIRIVHLLGEDGNFLSHGDLNNKFETNFNFLDVLKIKYSIPAEWRKTIENSQIFISNYDIKYYVNGTMYDFSKLKCKDIYWHIVLQRKRDPTCQARWAIEYPKLNEASDELWPNIYKLSFSITRETKLQSFQYRLIHHIITCRKKLFDMKLSENPKCLYCKNTDDIRHFFLFCPKVHAFWNSFFKWWNNLGDIEIAHNYECLEECIIFGFQLRGEIFDVLNYCILVGKYYIHRIRLFEENNICFFNFLLDLKFKLTIEHNICNKNDKLDDFKKFLFVYEQL
jgi:hypothetical protein